MVFKKQEKTCQMSAWKCEGYKTNDLQETENLSIFFRSNPYVIKLLLSVSTY